MDIDDIYENEKHIGKNNGKIKGNICISRCHDKRDNVFIHPLLFNPITIYEVDKANLCAIVPIIKEQYIPEILDYTHNKETALYANCEMKINEYYDENVEISNFLQPHFIDPSNFLKEIYNLKSFDDVIKFSNDNTELSNSTIKRIHSCAWKVYGINKNEIVDSVIYYYYDIVNKYWKKTFYNKIKSTKENITEQDINNIITIRFISICIFNYIDDTTDNWHLFDLHIHRIRKYIFEKIITKL
jgi:hypothetical protein